MAFINSRRFLDWLTRVLPSTQEPAAGIDSYITTAIPVIDAFGTHRVREIQFAQVVGALGGLEIIHPGAGPVPGMGGVNLGEYHHYLSAEVFHDDVGNHDLTFGRIVTRTPGPSGPGFPFSAFRDAIDAVPNRRYAVRGVTVPEGGWIAVQADAMGGGARMEGRFLWIELPNGEPLPLFR